jgi:hypothetical protein
MKSETEMVEIELGHELRTRDEIFVYYPPRPRGLIEPSVPRNPYGLIEPSDPGWQKAEDARKNGSTPNRVPPEPIILLVSRADLAIYQKALAKSPPPKRR